MKVKVAFVKTLTDTTAAVTLRYSGQEVLPNDGMIASL